VELIEVMVEVLFVFLYFGCLFVVFRCQPAVGGKVGSLSQVVRTCFFRNLNASETWKNKTKLIAF